MQIFLSPQQRSFFGKNKYIEFDGILSADEISLLKQTAENLLALRLKTTPEKLFSKSTIELFKAGRDLWLDNQKAKKQLIPMSLVQMAASLFQAASLRIGFTHYIKVGRQPASPYPVARAPLREICSFNDPVGAVLIKLDAKKPAVSEEFPLPQTEGSVLFLHPDFSFALDLLFNDPEQSYYLILFAPRNAIYILQKNDPLTHLLKKSGYAFGDALKDTTHPLVFRNSP